MQDFLLTQVQQLNIKITRLVTDSRVVQQGDTFVAYPGEHVDGRQFIGQAIAQGANAVLWEAQHFVWQSDWSVPNLGVSDLRHHVGWLADAVARQPSDKLWVVGVTGTNGKTSCSHWIARALNAVNQRCALIGTLGNGFVDALQASANTTPDAIRVHGLLANYVAQGAQAVAMEVSSHALAQGRVNGVRFDVALLTNLSRDHLDYHGDMQHYAASKRKLFDWAQLQYAVLNLDDAFGAEVLAQLQDKAVDVIGYGCTEAALQLAERHGIRMVHGQVQAMNNQGLHLQIRSSWGEAHLASGLLGRFNAENLLGVLAVLLVSDVPLQQAVHSLSQMQPVAGRMQRLGAAGQPSVIVDYAHTPDALEKVLQTVREINAASAGETLCVFGCGGDRDRGKRAMMGAVAERFASRCIVTSDNPRNEEPQQIINEILSGMQLAHHQVIADRGQAIASAIAQAHADDTVLLAGKGHEDYQEIQNIKQPFSDVEHALRALQNWHERAQA